MNLDNKIINATKWSLVTEIIAKFIAPLTNMILARILAPEAFGVLTTITMVISFADIFTDAGFQKYLVQHNFKNEIEKVKSTNVAFWTNLGVSITLWIIIMIFSDKISIMLGNPGLGHVISIACIQLIFTSFSSIQMAIYRRQFKFKELFIVRIIGICLPFFITIPLALLGLGYWALIIGNTMGVLVNAIILTLKSDWRPGFFYDIQLLKEMISFSLWSLIEGISIWLTVWIDVFIVSHFLDEYYLGLYRTSTTMVNSILAIITSSIIPVLFATLSRLQSDEILFKETFYKFQRIVAYLVFPLGVLVYVYRDLVTQILLGSQWREGADIIGIWSLTSLAVIVFSNFNSEVYRAKGKPKISFFSQIISLMSTIPVCIISLKLGFWSFIYARSLIRLQSVIVGFIFMRFLFHFSIKKIIVNIMYPCIFTLLMGLLGFWLKSKSESLLFDIISIFICIIVYLIFIIIFSKEDIEFLKKVIFSKFKSNSDSKLRISKN